MDTITSGVHKRHGFDSDMQAWPFARYVSNVKPAKSYEKVGSVCSRDQINQEEEECRYRCPRTPAQLVPFVCGRMDMACLLFSIWAKNTEKCVLCHFESHFLVGAGELGVLVLEMSRFYVLQIALDARSRRNLSILWPRTFRDHIDWRVNKQINCTFHDARTITRRVARLKSTSGSERKTYKDIWNHWVNEWVAWWNQLTNVQQ